MGVQDLILQGLLSSPNTLIAQGYTSSEVHEADDIIIDSGFIGQFVSEPISQLVSFLRK